MANGTRPQTVEEQRIEIEGTYQNQRRKTNLYAIPAVLAGIAITIAGIYNISVAGFPSSGSQRQREVFQRHNAAVISLTELERERSNLESNLPYLPYIPEDAKPHIANFYQERVGSLDEAIEVYKNDISEMRQSQDFRAEKERKRKSSKSDTGFLMVLLGSIFTYLSIVTFSVPGKIKRRELRKIEQLPEVDEIGSFLTS